MLLYLCDKILPDLRPPAGSPEPFSPDFSQHTLRALAKFCLAQAQECYFQRAVTDHKSNSVISKIAAKVGAYYAEALEQAQTAKSAGGAWPTWAFPAVSHLKAGKSSTAESLPQDWINHVTYRKWHFTAAAQYRKSLDDSASNKYGEELGRLHLAQKHVRTALDSPKKGIAQGVIIDIKSLHATLTDLITRAERDNRLIYHETVTSESSLPAILPADMVKATLPQEIEHPIARLHTGKGGLGQRPLFENVIPYAVHAAIALYEHRKETFLKEEIIQKKDQLDHTATRTLQKLNLPGALQAIEAPLGVPASLLRKAEDLRRDGGTKKLRTLSQDALSTASTNQQVLKDVKDLLQQEETEDSQLRTHFGKDKWNRQTSAALNSLLKGKMVKFEDTLNKAGKSDHLVRDKLAECEGTLRLLEGPAAAIEASIPRSGRDGSKYDDMSESASQGTLVQKLQAHLENLDDLIAARRRLVEDVQRTVTSDSIRASVMQMASELSAQSGEQLSTAQFEDVLQEEFTKYAFYADTLAGNQRRQEDLLSTAKQTNQQFLSARKSDATTKERERVLQQYDNAIVKYHELSANLTEALQFYQNFAKLLDQLRQNVKEVRALCSFPNLADRYTTDSGCMHGGSRRRTCSMSSTWATRRSMTKMRNWKKTQLSRSQIRSKPPHRRARLRSLLHQQQFERSSRANGSPECQSSSADLIGLAAFARTKECVFTHLRGTFEYCFCRLHGLSPSSAFDGNDRLTRSFARLLHQRGQLVHRFAEAVLHVRRK